MGKREHWDLPSGQGAVLLLLSALFVLGGAAGAMFAGLAGGEGAVRLEEYLNDYFVLVRDSGVPRELWPALWEQLRYVAAAAVLGVTALGVVGIPVLFCVRGFLFTFCVGCFCRFFGGAGLIPALVLFGLPALLWCPALFLAGLQGFSGSRCLLCRGLGDSRCPLPFTPAYWLRMGLWAGLALACGGLVYGVVPVLLRAAVRAVL